MFDGAWGSDAARVQVHDDEDFARRMHEAEAGELEVELPCTDQDLVSAMTTGPIQWSFGEADVPDKVRSLCVGSVHCANQ